MFQAPWGGVQSNCGLKLFGLVLSPRGDFKLKTTLSRGLKVKSAVLKKRKLSRSSLVPGCDTTDLLFRFFSPLQCPCFLSPKSSVHNFPVYVYKLVAYCSVYTNQNQLVLTESDYMKDQFALQSVIMVCKLKEVTGYVRQLN